MERENWNRIDESCKDTLPPEGQVVLAIAPDGREMKLSGTAGCGFLEGDCMKLLFCDLDGVLNRFGPAFSESLSDYNPQIEPSCVRAFNRIIRETEAKIVLSSSWRYLIHNGHFSLNGFQVFLRSHGIRGELIGYTREDLETADEPEPRWMQIRDWLRENGKKVVAPPDGPLLRYCILDDYSEAFGGRPGVQTNGAFGLTEEDATRAIQILGACGGEKSGESASRPAPADSPLTAKGGF